MRYHHVQLAIPAGREQQAREFWVGIMGFEEVPKPTSLAARGGAWFRMGELDLHLGVEEEFRPAAKAHPAFLVDNLASIQDRLQAAGIATQSDELFPGHARFYTHDPFGNRLEFLQHAE